MDRKAAIRDYKQSQRPMGVYQIRNTVSGKVFIGSSIDLPAMFNRIRFQLAAGMYPNTVLQQDWNEFGQDAFAFEILDTIVSPKNLAFDPTDDLKALEQLWLERVKPFGDNGYNVLSKTDK